MCNQAKFIEGKEISEKKARSILLDIGSALDYIHSNNIIHCDVKLNSIVINANNQIKLADFGLAPKTVDGFASGDCGTPYIKAPKILMQIPYTKAVDW
ncbi:uncharacterized protein MELLADRAFT_87046 [Melampsora larici-populina 98AG31]|uniref:Protein kinase domain-containing protein n=1 Tax=Melampsora larici-populina (strain 98AG31 / pathotype 3-4-7) TaxID=747676 RepID=F4R4B7_MELLP|nr:uncharacterized protein MELLADRAFT_87046 [Melampsora larici-populina 98AG31]EGG13029.1 hypothetical protein MELLADRAFT_87046 [Melampsora larici-populina 98AG31]